MLKTILLFGAGKSATVLIDYLISESATNNWKIIIADSNREQILLKTHHSPAVEAVQVDITNSVERAALIQRADIIISLMPPTLHYLVADDCIALEKNLLTASYVDEKIRDREDEIVSKGLLFICEMGLDPGIDHMSAMQIIHSIKANKGIINSFKSHCGGLIAPESDDNPWHYKVSWNPRNVVLAGKAGAEFKFRNEVKSIKYEELFATYDTVILNGLEKLAYYPNRDSLSYIPVYELSEAETFVRTTLRYPSFCIGWNAIIQAGLADDQQLLDINGLTFLKWSQKKISYFITKENRPLLEYLGLFEDDLVPANAKTSADILQYLLETRLSMLPEDKDMIVMLHEIGYRIGIKQYEVRSELIVKGENNLRTAMAKTVGLPLGIAAKLILNGTIELSGLHIPIHKEIYEPVLKELENFGIRFSETIIEIS